MAKKKKPIVCKKCSLEIEVGTPVDLDNRTKEWPFVAPMPDSNGNVTITQMAIWKCPKCGATIRGSVGKTKGEFQGKSKKLQIEEKLTEKVKFDIEVLAGSMGVEKDNLEKILTMMIKKGTAKGKIEGDMFIPA
ncbi:MAG: hypothetical protein OEY49_06255 [Candidatus Heimdallarchaeota archaeon]|nr:hypothetical protein [Candidatus Heimdallarchaeota archaeon]